MIEFRHHKLVVRVMQNRNVGFGSGYTVGQRLRNHLFAAASLEHLGMTEIRRLGRQCRGRWPISTARKSVTTCAAILSVKNQTLPGGRPVGASAQRQRT